MKHSKNRREKSQLAEQSEDVFINALTLPNPLSLHRCSNPIMLFHRHLFPPPNPIQSPANDYVIRHRPRFSLPTISSLQSPQIENAIDKNRKEQK